MPGTQDQGAAEASGSSGRGGAAGNSEPERGLGSPEGAGGTRSLEGVRAQWRGVGHPRAGRANLRAPGGWGGRGVASVGSVSRKGGGGELGCRTRLRPSTDDEVQGAGVVEGLGLSGAQGTGAPGWGCGRGCLECSCRLQACRPARGPWRRRRLCDALLPPAKAKATSTGHRPPRPPRAAAVSPPVREAEPCRVSPRSLCVPPPLCGASDLGRPPTPLRFASQALQAPRLACALPRALPGADGEGVSLTGGRGPCIAWAGGFETPECSFCQMHH